jgi:hypothetical protein
MLVLTHSKHYGQNEFLHLYKRLNYQQACRVLSKAVMYVTQQFGYGGKDLCAPCSKEMPVLSFRPDTEDRERKAL